MRLYVLRHAVRAADDPTFDSPLLLEGHIIAENLSEVLSNIKPRITHIYSSPFLRCIQTIAPFCFTSKQTPTVRLEHALYEYIRLDAGHDPDLFRRDWKFGIHSQLDTCLDTSYRSWYKLSDIGCNDLEVLKKRVIEFRHYLENTHDKDDVVLLVTHLSVLNVLRHEPDDTPFDMGGILEIKTT